MRIKTVILLFVFIVALFTRLPFLDHNYQHSFEADSEGNLDYTRSLYFFFKNPNLSKPHELSGYPTYLDGNFVVVAITANILRPLIKIGLIDVDVKDSDNSVIIFTHRWLALLFSSLTAVLLLSCLFSFGSSVPFGLIIVSLIYLFNRQHLEIDFMRVDHYLIFSFLFTFRMCQSVMRSQNSGWRWVLLGIASAMLLATKLNSPLYLIMVLTTAILVFREQRSRVRMLSRFFLGFIPVTFLLWINWLLYPEYAVKTIIEILGVAHGFIGYLSIKPYFFYHFQQFSIDGQYLCALPMVVAVGWAIWILIWSLRQNTKKDLLVLLILFLAHSLYAILTLKLNRYGVFFPVYYSLLIGATSGVTTSVRHKKVIVAIAMGILILPQGIANVQHYSKLKKLADGREESIRITRLRPRAWISSSNEHLSCICLKCTQR